MLTIALKRKHFIRTNFYSDKNCAIAKALKERYQTPNVYVATYGAVVDGEFRDLQTYYYSHNFAEDKIKASVSGPLEEVIRTVIFE